MIKRVPKEQLRKQQKESEVSTPVSHPIQISIVYGWMEHGERLDGLNEHWKFLKKEVTDAVGTFESLAKKRTKPPLPLRVTVSRLRGRHGAGVLSGLTKRIERSDILIFDISGHNPNVLFELGYALLFKGLDSENIFIFQRKGAETPSDLRSFMRTEYNLLPAGDAKQKGRQGGFAKLTDARGFKGALISSLKEIALQKSMWGKATTSLEVDEEDFSSQI